MAFNVFTNGTGNTASATEVMQNFYHIFDGDRLPRSGTLMEPTTGVYDIGSSAYKWNQLHCVNFVVDTINTSDKKIWKILYSAEISAPASSIDITGIGKSNQYILEMYLTDNTATSISVIFNGDSSTSYGYIRYDSGGTVEDTATSLLFSSITRANTSTAYYSFVKSNICSYDGYGTFLYRYQLGPFMSTTYSESYQWGVYNKTTTITSIKLIANENNGIGIGTTVNLFGRF